MQRIAPCPWFDSQAFIELNGGPLFKFNEATSLTVNCETQAEVDYYWDKAQGGRSSRVMNAMLRMKKLDIEKLKKAAAG